MTYREDLPENCPPDTAIRIEQTAIFYRLIEQWPPTERDFHSVWELHPERHRRLRIEECKAKGLSVFDTPQAAQVISDKYEEHSHKTVCEVRITPDSGKIQQGYTNHYTWWPFRDCEPADLCSEYKP